MDIPNMPNMSQMSHDDARSLDINLNGLVIPLSVWAPILIGMCTSICFFGLATYFKWGILYSLSSATFIGLCFATSHMFIRWRLDRELLAIEKVGETTIFASPYIRSKNYFHFIVSLVYVYAVWCLVALFVAIYSIISFIILRTVIAFISDNKFVIDVRGLHAMFMERPLLSAYIVLTSLLVFMISIMINVNFSKDSTEHIKVKYALITSSLEFTLIFTMILFTTCAVYVYGMDYVPIVKAMFDNMTVKEIFLIAKSNIGNSLPLKENI